MCVRVCVQTSVVHLSHTHTHAHTLFAVVVYVCACVFVCVSTITCGTLVNVPLRMFFPPPHPHVCAQALCAHFRFGCGHVARSRGCFDAAVFGREISWTVCCCAGQCTCTDASIDRSEAQRGEWATRARLRPSLPPTRLCLCLSLVSLSLALSLSLSLCNTTLQHFAPTPQVGSCPALNSPSPSPSPGPGPSSCPTPTPALAPAPASASAPAQSPAPTPTPDTAQPQPQPLPQPQPQP